MKVPTLGADTVVLDLEDGVPLNLKDQARKMVLESLSTTKFNGAEKAVRINDIRTVFGVADMRAFQSLSNPSNLHAIVMPKVERVEQIEFANKLLNERKGFDHVALIACIESARGLLNVNQIAESSPRLQALVFASEDYCADVGCIRSESMAELLYARSVVVTAAKANNLQAIDLVCIEYKSNDKLKSECFDGRGLGFTGKQAIHPCQISIIQEMFMPTAKDIKNAQNIVTEFEEHSKSGTGAFEYQGNVVDMPVYKNAVKILIAAGLK